MSAISPWCVESGEKQKSLTGDARGKLPTSTPGSLAFPVFRSAKACSSVLILCTTQPTVQSSVAPPEAVRPTSRWGAKRTPCNSTVSEVPALNLGSARTYIGQHMGAFAREKTNSNEHGCSDEPQFPSRISPNAAAGRPVVHGIVANYRGDVRRGPRPPPIAEDGEDIERRRRRVQAGLADAVVRKLRAPRLPKASPACEKNNRAGGYY